MGQTAVKEFSQYSDDKGYSHYLECEKVHDLKWELSGIQDAVTDLITDVNRMTAEIEELYLQINELKKGGEQNG